MNIMLKKQRLHIHGSKKECSLCHCVLYIFCLHLFAIEPFTHLLIHPRQRDRDAVQYLGLPASHQCAHEGDVAPRCDVAIGSCRLRSAGLGARSGLARQAGLIHRQVNSLSGVCVWGGGGLQGVVRQRGWNDNIWLMQTQAELFMEFVIRYNGGM